MDNLKIKKIWSDDDLFELRIEACSEFVSAYQKCYIQKQELINLSEKILNINNYKNNNCYLEFGIKTGNYTPAFSMNILPVDVYGHLKIEVDIEIEDNDERRHRCLFYVNSDLGCVERFGYSLKESVEKDDEIEVVLNDCN